MFYIITVSEINIKLNTFRLVLNGEIEAPSEIARINLIMRCSNGTEERRLPAVITERQWNPERKTLTIASDYVYLLDYLFWKNRGVRDNITISMDLLCGEKYIEKIQVDKSSMILEQDGQCYLCVAEEKGICFIPKKNDKCASLVKGRMEKLCHYRSAMRHFCTDLKGGGNKVEILKFYMDKVLRKKNRNYISRSFQQYKAKYPVALNRVSFISVRRTEMGGNFAFVYEKVKGDQSLDIQVFLNTKDLIQMSKAEMDKFADLCATSKVIFLDEYTPYIHYFDLNPETKVIQLWHACGAFKTFGFSRLGKPKGSPQNTRNHRNYDYVTVSSKNVRECYAEGFGIPVSHVIPTGIPRTDVFFDKVYAENMRNSFYRQFPQIADKKVILFAPTFRGNVREQAGYPMEMFQVGDFMDAMGEEYFLIIKHHPFVTDHHPVPSRVSDRVLDLSGSTELNDLLFVTDMIITDYSSLVFEASLLSIPMFFYTFDLKQYITERDFYFDFEHFVPGSFFYTQEALQNAILNQNFEIDNVEKFAQKFFDDFDGHSTDRVVKLFYHALRE